MRADELVSRLAARGLAREVAAAVGTRRAVAFQTVEVAVAESADERSMRARWRERVGTTGVKYLLIADDPDNEGSVLALGPRTVEEPVRSVDCAALAGVVEKAAGMGALDGVRHIAGEMFRLAGRGMVVRGLLTRHTLEARFRGDPSCWSAATAAAEGLSFKGIWRSVLDGLGYEIQRLPIRGYLACYEGRPVAVVHPKASAEDFLRLDQAGRPSEGVLAQDCANRGARYGILACRNRYRLFDCDPAASTSRWVELDAQLLDEDRRGYLALLGPRYLAAVGLADLQAEAERFGAELRQRLDRTAGRSADSRSLGAAQQWACKLLDDPSVVAPPAAAEAYAALQVERSTPVRRDLAAIKSRLDAGRITPDEAARRIADTVEHYGLRAAEPPDTPTAITEDDIGVVCWMSVLPRG